MMLGSGKVAASTTTTRRAMHIIVLSETLMHNVTAKMRTNQSHLLALPSTRSLLSRALFSSEKISDFGTVAFSFVCGKYYPIID